MHFQSWKPNETKFKNPYIILNYSERASVQRKSDCELKALAYVVFTEFTVLPFLRLPMQWLSYIIHLSMRTTSITPHHACLLVINNCTKCLSAYFHTSKEKEHIVFDDGTSPPPPPENRYHKATDSCNDSYHFFVIISRCLYISVVYFCN